MRATGAESGSETGEEENQPAIPHIEFMKTRVDVTWRRDRGSSENDLYLEIREEFFYLESRKDSSNLESRKDSSNLESRKAGRESRTIPDFLISRFPD
jgi:hypothetical protein